MPPAYDIVPSQELKTNADARANVLRDGWDSWRVIISPAAGPRNFMTMGLDQYILTHWTDPQHQPDKAVSLKASNLTVTPSVSSVSLVSSLTCSSNASDDGLPSQDDTLPPSLPPSPQGSPMSSPHEADSQPTSQLPPPSPHLPSCSPLLNSPRWLMGGSMGALRWCALLSGRTDRVQKAFSSMYYARGDTPTKLMIQIKSLFELAAPDPDVIVHHPTIRLAFFVTAMQPWVAMLPDKALYPLMYSLLGASFAFPSVPNLVQRRYCFYSGPEPPPFLSHEKDITFLPLTSANLHQVLHATTCVPLVSEKCTYISGIGRGLYFDGALGDYQLNVTIKDPAWPALVLGLDLVDTPVKARIWDAYVPGRVLPEASFRHVSLLAPNKEYREQMPRQRLPDLWDFFTEEYIRQPQLRMELWDKSYALSKSLIPPHPASLLGSLLSIDEQESIQAKERVKGV